MRHPVLTRARSFHLFAALLASLALPGCSGTATQDDMMQAPPPDLSAMKPPEDLRPPADLAGTCRTSIDCAGGASCCANKCVDVMSDPSHCGGCSMPCGAGSTCCSGRCANLDSDVANCGKCGTACPAEHGKPNCAKGVCGVGSCDNGWINCNAGAPDGCETDGTRDVANCGTCGMACMAQNGVPGCSDSKCALASCNAGFADCNLTVGDGCEVATSADAKNCGACGADCSSRPNAVVACTGGMCTVKSCNGGFLDCDGNAANGCEVDGNINTANCGACRNQCPANTVCKAGVCTCPPCTFPGVRVASCVNMKCQIDGCFVGYEDCDKVVQNGCEALLASDAKNCGACGVVCGAQTPFCQGAKCSLVGTSCLQLKQVNPNLPDGVYTLDVDGNGPKQPFQGFCDMTTDGGGWIVCYQHNIVDVEEMNHSTVTNMGTQWGTPGPMNEFGSDCRGIGHALMPAAVRLTSAGGIHWVQANNPPDAFHDFFFAGNAGAGQMVNITTWNSQGMSYNRLFCNHDCAFGANTNNIGQIGNGTNSGVCFEHNSKNSDSNHHWATWGKCDGTYVEGPNQGAGGAQPDQPRAGWARVMLR